MRYILLLFVCFVYTNFIKDLNVEFFADNELKVRKTHFIPKERVYTLMTLYNKQINTNKTNCFIQTDCLKNLTHNYNPLNIDAGSCPLSYNKNIYMVIESVYLITEDKSNKYTLYKESPRYYGIDKDSTITHYRYENNSYCVTQVVFSFILKKYHSEFGTSTLPNLVIHYTYVISNKTINIENYKHIGTQHQRKKITNNIYTCCTVENCGYFHPLSCFRFFEIDVAVMVSFLIMLLILVCIVNYCHKCRIKKFNNQYKPVYVFKEEDIDKEFKENKIEFN